MSPLGKKKAKFVPSASGPWTDMFTGNSSGEDTSAESAAASSSTSAATPAAAAASSSVAAAAAPAATAAPDTSKTTYLILTNKEDSERFDELRARGSTFTNAAGTVAEQASLATAPSPSPPSPSPPSPSPPSPSPPSSSSPAIIPAATMSELYADGSGQHGTNKLITTESTTVAEKKPCVYHPNNRHALYNAVYSMGHTNI